MFGLIKKFVLWKYDRESTPYLVFCLLIVAFIFLTPKYWFDKREKLATQTTRLIVKAKDFSPDKSEREKRVREISGNSNAQIVDWREKTNADGELIYEIEIR
jgi:hypothetical protein